MASRSPTFSMPFSAAQLGSWTNFGLRNRDVAFALGVVMVLGMLFVPLPPILLDFGLAISLSVSVLILMIALWIPKPLTSTPSRRCC